MIIANNLLCRLNRRLYPVNSSRGLPTPLALDAFQLEPSLKCPRAINELVRISNHVIAACVRCRLLVEGRWRRKTRDVGSEHARQLSVIHIADLWGLEKKKKKGFTTQISSYFLTKRLKNSAEYLIYTSGKHLTRFFYFAACNFSSKNMTCTFLLQV